MQNSKHLALHAEKVFTFNKLINQYLHYLLCYNFVHFGENNNAKIMKQVNDILFFFHFLRMSLSCLMFCCWSLELLLFSNCADIRMSFVLNLDVSPRAQRIQLIFYLQSYFCRMCFFTWFSKRCCKTKYICIIIQIIEKKRKIIAINYKLHDIKVAVKSTLKLKNR